MYDKEYAKAWRKKNAEYYRKYQLLWKRRWRLKQGMKPLEGLPECELVLKSTLKKKRVKLEKEKVLKYKDYLKKDKQRNEKRH